MKNVSVIPEVVKDQRDFATQMAEAKSFFADKKLSESPKYLLEDNPYADKDGLIEFIFGSPLEEDPVVMENLTKQKKDLIAITSVVTDYVNRYAEAYGESYKTDIELWTLALSKIPLMGPSRVDEQTYSRHIRGIEIAKDFIDFILEIVASEGSSALESFSKFLDKQGDALRFGVEKMVVPAISNTYSGKHRTVTAASFGLQAQSKKVFEVIPF